MKIETWHTQDQHDEDPFAIQIVGLDPFVKVLTFITHEEFKAFIQDAQNTLQDWEVQFTPEGEKFVEDSTNST